MSVLYWVVKLSVWTKIHTSRPLNCFVVFLCCFNLSFITIAENCIPLHTHRYVVFTPFLTDQSNCLIPILTLFLIETYRVNKNTHLLSPKLLCCFSLLLQPLFYHHRRKLHPVAYPSVCGFYTFFNRPE